MKNANLIFNSVLLIGSVYFFALTFYFPTRFGIEDSGPTIFPRFALICLVVLLLVDSLIILRKNSSIPLFSKGEKKKLIRFFLLLVIIFTFVFFLGNLNFVMIACISLFFMGLTFNIKWITSLITSVVLTLFIYFVFIEGLNIIL